MDLSGSGMSTVRSTTSSESGLRVGEEGMDEVEIESPKATIGDDSSERLPQQTVTSLIIHSHPSN